MSEEGRVKNLSEDGRGEHSGVIAFFVKVYRRLGYL